MAGYQIKRCVLKKTCEFLKTLKIEKIEKVSLCLGVFDKIEVATIGIDETTIALTFQSSLIARLFLNLPLRALQRTRCYGRPIFFLLQYML